MKTFSEGFTHEQSEKDLLEAINNLYGAELDKTRDYIEKQHQKYLKLGSGYFFIDLRTTSPPVRQIVMEDVCARFKFVLNTKKTDEKSDNSIFLPLLAEDTGDKDAATSYIFDVFYDRTKRYDKSQRLCHYDHGANDENGYLVAMSGDFIDKRKYLEMATKKSYCICPKKLD